MTTKGDREAVFSDVPLNPDKCTRERLERQRRERPDATEDQIEVARQGAASPAAASRITAPTPFGERLLAAADHAQMTQTALERALGLHRGRLSRLITRRFSAVEIELIRRVRDITLVRTDWLLFGEEPMLNPHPTPIEKAQRSAYQQGIPYEVIAAAKEVAREDPRAGSWNEIEWWMRFRAANDDRLRTTGLRRGEKSSAAWRKKRRRRGQDAPALAEEPSAPLCASAEEPDDENGAIQRASKSEAE